MNTFKSQEVILRTKEENKRIFNKYKFYFEPVWNLKESQDVFLYYLSSYAIPEYKIFFKKIEDYEKKFNQKKSKTNRTRGCNLINLLLKNEKFVEKIEISESIKKKYENLEKESLNNHKLFTKEIFNPLKDRLTKTIETTYFQAFIKSKVFKNYIELNNDPDIFTFIEAELIDYNVKEDEDEDKSKTEILSIESELDVKDIDLNNFPAMDACTPTLTDINFSYLHVSINKILTWSNMAANIRTKDIVSLVNNQFYQVYLETIPTCVQIESNGKNQKYPMVIVHERGVLPFSLHDILYTLVDEEYERELEYGLTESSDVGYIESCYSKNSEAYSSEICDFNEIMKEIGAIKSNKEENIKLEEKYSRTILVRKYKFKKVLSKLTLRNLNERIVNQQSTVRHFNEGNKIVIYRAGYYDKEQDKKNGKIKQFIMANPIQIERISDGLTQYHNSVIVNFMGKHNSFKDGINIIRKIRANKNPSKHFHNKLNLCLMDRKKQNNGKTVKPEKHHRLLDTYDDFIENLKNNSDSEKTKTEESIDFGSACESLIK